jgi:excisionase family DNA binding protein
MEKMNQRQAAEYLWVCQHTIKRWVSKGILKCTCIGAKKRVYFKEDLDALKKQLNQNSWHPASRLLNP